MPLINALAFGFSAIFKNVHEASITMEQFEAYEFSMITMIGLLAVTIPLFEGLLDVGKITNKTVNVLYILLFIVITVLTVNQFSFRPYEHSLTLLSVVSLLATREFLNRGFLRHMVSIK